MWKLAREFIIDRHQEDALLWQPSSHVCTVHRTAEGWRADWPDEESVPLPDATVAWLLWHVEWWWNDTLGRIAGQEPLAPTAHEWSGSTAGMVAAKERWDDVLSTADLDSKIDWLLPEPQPLWFIAAWVNAELTKNLAEMNQILTLRANTH